MTQKEKQRIITALSSRDTKNHLCFAATPPLRAESERIIYLTLSLLFPDYFAEETTRLAQTLDALSGCLAEQISRAHICLGRNNSDSVCMAEDILRRLPTLREEMTLDALAIYSGDPAATCPGEVILSYPGFYAIAVYRLAHELYLRNIPLIPRQMSEIAHEKTGIDIHPGASVGESFSIDHGTGIVIGETAVIGKCVKLYQGVTLGAKSFESDAEGNIVRGKKRHPNVGDNCVIYAGATILGGDTVIGEGSIIGGNVWLTHSVAPGSKVYYKA